MAEEADIREHDSGTLIRVTVTEDGIPVNISDATAKKIKFRRKDKTVFSVDADFETSGSDGILLYTSGSGTFNQSGEWRMQVYLETPAGKWHSDIQNFTVGEILTVNSTEAL